MESAAIYEKLKSRFDDRAFELKQTGGDAFVVINSPSIDRVAGYLKEDEELWFDSLLCLSAVDEGENLAVVYHLFSMLHRHRFALKALVSSHNPTLPSVEHVWKAANWYEREAYDLMGIRFDGHPDLRRILLPDDWPGHPLRKDYVFPDEYDGIPCMRE